MPSPQSNHLPLPLQMINVTAFAPCPCTTMSTEMPRGRPAPQSALGMFQDGSEDTYGQEYRRPSDNSGWFASDRPASGWLAYTDQEHDSLMQPVIEPVVPDTIPLEREAPSYNMPQEDPAQEDPAAASQPRYSIHPNSSMIFYHKLFQMHLF
ncbi:hypothetical protein HMN09_00392700 [Mycena chlorophos]|uniref:Uncharacterized protein n=1 Tax=Mycena chlorophos TaxID=658473 RepID=A0A8H6TH32_MYCCL|nr:hypothetical protein HMN09_00392700 [Mycena chlorophos]